MRKVLQYRSLRSADVTRLGLGVAHCRMAGIRLQSSVLWLKS